MRTVHAQVDPQGNLRPDEPLKLPPGARVVLTIVAEAEAGEAALLSEGALAVDWERPEEEAAWSHLRPASS